MNNSSIRWGRVFRRGAALFMSTVAVWGLLLTAGTGAAVEAFKSMGENALVISSLLRSELGEVATRGPLGGMNNWDRLLLDQSPLLRSNADAVAKALTGGPHAPGVTPPAGGESAQGDPLNRPKEDPEQDELPPTVTAAPADIVPRTLLPTSTEGYNVADGVYIFNRTDLGFDAAALSSAPVTIRLGDAAAPQVLIMHTHATEAYTPHGTDLYVPSDQSRTLDNTRNMVRVGAEMKAVFESMGLSVLHDETPYDYPAYSGAYTRSGEGVKKYLEQYPSIKIVLDIHRDALIGADGTVYKTMTTMDGAQVAQVGLVLGSPQKGEHPLWQENLTLAMKLQKSMNTLYPTLARPITVSSPVYNQNLTTGSLLVEVGSHGNTLQEAIGAARLFARAAGQVILGLRG
jgi:stage II sporulation protein P